MTTPRPGSHLRLVGGPTSRSTDTNADAIEFEPIERDAHDLHPPYRELAEPPELALVVDEQEAHAETERAAPSPRFVVVALISFQLLATLNYVGRYVALASGGDVYGVAALLTLPASLCLYAGALLLALRPGRGRVPFIVAAVGLGLSVPAWGVSAGWTWPMAFGAMLALAGAWYARAEVRPAADAEAQP
jgi:hypothetical protein